MEKSKDNIEPSVVWTDSNVVQLFCLLAERDFLLTKFVWVVSACIKIAAESFLKFTQVFRMLKLSKNYQVKVEIADSKLKCHKSWVHICFWMIFFHFLARTKMIKTVILFPKPLERMAQTFFRLPQCLIKQMLDDLLYIFLWQTLKPLSTQYSVTKKLFVSFFFSTAHISISLQP